MRAESLTCMGENERGENDGSKEEGRTFESESGRGTESRTNAHIGWQTVIMRLLGLRPDHDLDRRSFTHRE